jgi:AcrR family transcriptional regulator
MTARRRRGDELTSAIRAATLAELADHGYPGVGFQGVARRATTSRSVLHRRYASRAQMVADALLDASFAPPVRPPGPSLREDLISLLLVAGAQYERIGLDTMRALLAEADDDVRAKVAARTRDLVQAMLVPTIEAARDRRELGPAPLPDRVVMLAVTLLRHDMLMGAALPDRDEAVALSDDILLPLLHATSHRPPEAPRGTAGKAR